MHVVTSIRTRSLARPLALAAAAAFAVVPAGCGSSSSGSDEDTFRIASPSNASGDAAIIGETYRPGLDAAVAQINADGGILGRRVVVDYKDVQSDPQRAAQVLGDMLSRGDYGAVIATSAGATTLPLLEAVKARDALGVFTGGVPDAADPDRYPTQFDLKYSLEDQARATGCLALRYQPRRAALLYLDTEFQAKEAELWKRQLADAGVDVVAEEAFPADKLDLTAQVQRVAAADPDVVIVETYGPTLKAAFQAIADTGLRAQVVGGTNVSATPPELVLGSLALVPPRAVALAWPNAIRAGGRLTPAQRRAADAIEEEIGGRWQAALSTYAFDYDAAWLVKWAAEKAGSTETEDMARALETLGEQPAETGALTAPGYTPESHGYGNTTFHAADLAKPTQSGTYASSGEIACEEEG